MQVSGLFLDMLRLAQANREVVVSTLRPLEVITARILVVRTKRVLIDADLATLYGVTTKRLNEQVKRNAARFPADFMFRLTRKEKKEVVANCDHLENLKFSGVLPHVFTEFGAIQAANVLNSPKAVQTSVYVVRVFMRLRDAVGSSKELEQRFNELERKVGIKLGAHDRAIAALIESLRAPAVPTEQKRRPIGFVHTKE